MGTRLDGNRKRHFLPAGFVTALCGTRTSNVTRDIRSVTCQRCRELHQKGGY